MKFSIMKLVNSHPLFYAAIVSAIIIFILGGYVALPMEGWVVDKATHKPVEGMVVVANWPLSGGMEGGNDEGPLMVMETITDKNGHYSFPWWGPRIASGRIKEGRPWLMLLKTGYEAAFRANSEPSSLLGPILVSDWNKKVIEVERRGSNAEIFIRQFAALNDALSSIIRHGEECDWEKIKYMLREFQKQRIELMAEKITYPKGQFRELDYVNIDIDVIDREENYSEKAKKFCASPQKFFNVEKQSKNWGQY